MPAHAKLIRSGDEIEVTLKMKLTPGTPMLESEEQIREALDEAGKLITREALAAFDTDGSAIELGEIRLTSKGQQNKDYETPYGKVPCPRHVYQSSDGGKTFCPLDQQARIVGSSTPRFAKMCAFKYAASSAGLACLDLKQNHGRNVSRCYLQDVSEEVGWIAQEKQPDWKYADPELPAPVSTVAVGVDGACVFYLEGGWRQAMVGTIALYDAFGQRLHTSYVAAPPEQGKAAFYQEMEEEIGRYKQRYRGVEWVGLADGAHDHWKWLEPFVHKLILDYWHAAGYLEKAAAGVNFSKAARKPWSEESRRRLKEENGAARQLWEEMKDALRDRPARGEARKGLEAAISYFGNHLDKMDYSQYQREHRPIGSGVTEAACKTVIKQRLCGAGMKWKPTGAATVLRLRSMVLTEGRWEQFWDKVSRFGF